jgi:MFS family permease
LVMVSSVGAMLGTVLGTLSVQHATWRWTFFLVLPLGLVAAYLAYALGRLNRFIVVGATMQPRRFDVVGGVLLFAMLSALSLGLSHLHAGEQSFTAGWFYHLPFVTLGFYCLLAFLAAERRAVNPLVPFRHFRSLLLTSAVIGNGLLHMTMLGIFVLTPFYMERGLQLTTTYVAILLTAQQFYNVLTSYLGGWLHDQTQARWIRPVGMGVICLGFFTLGLTAPVLTFATYMLIALPIGVGMGTFMSVNNTVIMSAVPGNLRGFASGMLETTRQGGHMFAVPLVSGIMAGVTGTTLTADADPALYIQGFQAACMVVGGIGLIAMACAFVPERCREGKGCPATPVGLAVQPDAQRTT